MPRKGVSLGSTVVVVKVEVSSERVMGMVCLPNPTERTCEVIGPREYISDEISFNRFSISLRNLVVRALVLVVISGGVTVLSAKGAPGCTGWLAGPDVPVRRGLVPVDTGAGLLADSWIGLSVAL